MFILDTDTLSLAYREQKKVMLATACATSG